MFIVTHLKVYYRCFKFLQNFWLLAIPICIHSLMFFSWRLENINVWILEAKSNDATSSFSISHSWKYPLKENGKKWTKEVVSFVARRAKRGRTSWISRAREQVTPCAPHRVPQATYHTWREELAFCSKWSHTMIFWRAKKSDKLQDKAHLTRKSWFFSGFPFLSYNFSSGYIICLPCVEMSCRAGCNRPIRCQANLQAFYHECRSLIEYATHNLFNK